MATIWRVFDGNDPTVGGPAQDIPIADAARLLNLSTDGYLSPPDQTPRFEAALRAPWIAGHRHVVVELDSDEAHGTDWQPGFYRSPLKPSEALKRFIADAFLSELGVENVVRVEHKPTTDSQSRNALKVSVIIAPDAIAKLPNAAALDALVKLRTRLNQFGDPRTPIVDYATEAELEQIGAS